MSIQALSWIGGLVSLVSTAVGALLLFWMRERGFLERTRTTIDFALGVMLSAAAFGLVGPQLSAAQANPFILHLVIAGFILGMIFVGFSEKVYTALRGVADRTGSRHLLIFTLVMHNLPEGMAAGATAAGLEPVQSIPILLGIAVQNVPEGFLVAVCLMGVGFGIPAAVAGGVLSGVVEGLGAVAAGTLLSTWMDLLPFLLSFAGGAMVLAVLIELREMLAEKRVFAFRQFVVGLLLIPLLNLLQATV